VAQCGKSLRLLTLADRSRARRLGHPKSRTPQISKFPDAGFSKIGTDRRSNRTKRPPSAIVSWIVKRCDNGTRAERSRSDVNAVSALSTYWDKMLRGNVGINANSRARPMYILPLFFLLIFLPLCDSIENGWNGIKPLHSNRLAVDKLVGEPKIDFLGYANYAGAEQFVHVTYSKRPCSEDRLGRGEYNVPENTVLNFQVVMRKELKLKDLRFSPEKYRRVADTENPTLTHYYNDNDGITIETGRNGDTEYVGQIIYRPSKPDIAKYRCKM